jgi:glycolate oxidase
MSEKVDKVIKEIIEAIGADKVFSEYVDRLAYSRDWSARLASDKKLPDLVVSPTSTDEVVEIVKIAEKYNMPVIPCGGLTGMAGGTVPTHGGIMIETKNMNRILEIDKDNLNVTVQAGISIAKLNEGLEKNGLWFPIDPESKLVSTVGASIATRNDSTFAIKYGKIEHSLINAVLVTGRGEKIRVGHRKTLISASGYPLHWLLVGSEGTLGIITEATLRIFPKPSDRSVDMLAFQSLGEATKAINRVVQAGLSIESANLMEVNRFFFYTHAYREKYGRPAQVPEGTKGILCLTFNGDEEIVKFSRDYMLKTCRELGGVPIEEREIVEAWWTGKHRLDFVPFKQKWPDSQREMRFSSADISVPQGKLDEAYEKWLEISAKYGIKVLGMNVYIQAPYSVHTSISFAVYVDDSQPKYIRNFYNYVKDMALYAVSVGGSMSSYQGDAERFGPLLREEHGEAYNYMKNIKEVFDPKNIMNTGKKFGNRTWLDFMEEGD